MKLPSFRLRIALLSAALAGSALVGFGAVSWWLIYDAKISLLDARLQSPMLRLLRFHDGDRTPELEGELSRQVGASDAMAAVVWVVNDSGTTIYRSQQWPSDLAVESLLRSLPAPPPMPPPNFEQGNAQSRDRRPDESRDRINPPTAFLSTQRTPTDTWRVAALAFPDRRVAIAVSLQSIRQEMGTIRNIFLVAIPGALLLVAGGAWVVAGQALSPVRRLTQAIQAVTVQGLDQRIATDAMDVEFIELIQVFNQMLERLERSFKQASRFSADAAHELKTPLAILQGELERALQQAESGSPLQQQLGQLLDEVRRLSGIVRKLLLLSLADAGQMRLQLAEVNLSEILQELIDDLELLAPELSVKTSIQPGLRVNGDRDLLTQLVQNLLSNAIKYNLPNGWIHINAHHHAEQVWVTIANASNDIPPDDRDRIFDRFHRVDPARTRKVEGTGLGLNLAWEIARAHGGQLQLDPPTPGQTSLTLNLQH